jgi:hypothetical protein
LRRNDKRIQGGGQILDLLVAEVRLHGPGLERFEVPVELRLRLGDLAFDPRELLLHGWFLRDQQLVRLGPQARHEILVSERRPDVLDDRRLEEVGAHIVLVAFADTPALVAEVIGELAALLTCAHPDHVGLALGAVDDAGQQAFFPVVAT